MEIDPELACEAANRGFDLGASRVERAAGVLDAGRGVGRDRELPLEDWRQARARREPAAGADHEDAGQDEGSARHPDPIG